jgi:hypothetical protein
MLIEEPDGTLTVIGVCLFCDHFSELRGVSKTAYEKWRGGVYADDAFPDMTIAERETLISGTHEKCYDNAFGKDDVLTRNTAASNGFSERLMQWRRRVR